MNAKIKRKRVAMPAPRTCTACGYYVNTNHPDCPKCGAGMPASSRTRAKPRHFEDAHQKAFFAWAALVVSAHPDLAKMYHVPNGGARNPGEGGKLKAMGVRPGVPDRSLDVARGGFFGLRIELKPTKAELGRAPTVSPEQYQRIETLRKDGYFADVAYGWEEARDMALWYLSKPRTQPTQKEQQTP